MSRLNDCSPTFRSRDHRDTKDEFEVRMSSNEKEEERKKLDGTRVELRCEMRCEAGQVFHHCENQ